MEEPAPHAETNKAYLSELLLWSLVSATRLGPNQAPEPERSNLHDVIC